jgi:superfamily I DNA/RNA helicase
MSGKWENPDVPHSGWECVDIEDLAAHTLTCQMCEHEKIRYAHYMRHSNYPNMLVVGCICAGNMQGNLEEAKKRDSFMKSRMSKRKRWLERIWKISQKGNQYIKSDGFIVVMKYKNGLWGAFVKSEDGNFEKWSTKRIANENVMKLAAFDCLTNVLAGRIPENQPVIRTPQIPVKTEFIKEALEIKEPEVKKQIAKKPEEISIAKQEIKLQKNTVQGDLFQLSAETEDEPEKETIESKLSEPEVDFTSEQKNIFNFIKNGKGHGIIDAVAGAGKTTTIMECSKYVEDKTDILFCAFNKSIQTEIVRKFNRQGLNQVTVKTIHALGFQILRDNNNAWKNLIPNEEKYSSILNKDTDLQNKFQEYIEEILDINGYKQGEMEKNRRFAAKNIVYKFKDRLLDMNQKFRATLTPNGIENFKNMTEHFNFFSDVDTKSKSFNRELEIYFECNNILLDAGNNAAKEALIIDYTDMLYLPYIWDLRSSKNYSFLFIDECQDLSKSQLAVVLKYGKKGGRILAVGDPYQSIYGFAGADIESFKRIKNTIKAKPLPLTCCFRCPPNIVKLASSIRNDITASKQEQGKIEEISLCQAVKIARINDLIISRYREPILFLVFEFINKNIQVQVHKDEVNDIIDELKNLFKQEERAVIIADNSGNFESIKEIVLNRWLFIIEKEAEKLENSSEKSVYIKAKTDYLTNKLEFMHKKYLQWKESCQTINDMLVKIKDFISSPDNCIKLSTIHRAKGLEAQRVFILNFNDLPYFRPNQKPWEKIQEQNLKYVAITRTLNELYLVKSEKQDDIKKNASLFDEFMIEQ